MATYSGNGKPFVGAYNVGLQAPLDTRLVVDSKANLLDRSDAAGALGRYTYIGMPVIVKSENAIYILTAADSTVEANWAKLPTMGDISSLIGAMHFIAVLPVVSGEDFSDALATYKASHLGYAEQAGDIFIWGTKEYIYNGTAWQEFGDEANVVTSIGGEKGAITLKSDNTARGTINIKVYTEGANKGMLYAELILPNAEDMVLGTYEIDDELVTLGANTTINGAIAQLEYRIQANKSAAEAAIEALDEKYEAKEEATATALTDLDTRVKQNTSDIEELKAKQDINCYTKTVTTGTSVEIAAAEHGCGVSPMVTCYYEGQLVELVQALGSTGTVTLSWNSNTVVSAEHPIKVIIMGIPA